MRITGDWLTSKNTQAVLSMLTGADYQAYAVGGCVRNALLSVPVSDIDIATDAMPEKVASLAENSGLKAIPTGIEHGTITVICNSEPFEITTFRKDIETDGRRATISYSDNINEDAIRRDFTVNALYVEADGTLHDPLNGFVDIEKRRIRFIEDAAQRIEEDYLRILRFFRFTAWYGNPDAGLDAEGLAACAAHVEGIQTLSKERLGAEMKKLLAAPDPAPVLSAMAISGVLAQVLPGSDPQFVAPLVFLEQSANVVPSWRRRMVALGGEGQAIRLRLSKAETKQLGATKLAIQAGEHAAIIAYRYGADAALDAKLIEAASLSAPLPSGLKHDINKGAAAEFPVRGADLIKRIGAGPHLGKELNRLEELWISSDFKLDKKDLLQR